jgi:hypothetical protein
MKITINGKEYGSLDEVPEEFRSIIREGVERELGHPSPGGKTVIRKTIRFAAGQAVPPEVRQPLEEPREYRRKVEGMQSGRIPPVGPLEPLFTPVLVLAIVAAISSLLSSLKAGGRPGMGTAMIHVAVAGASAVGIAWLWDRRRRRELYPVFQDVAGRLPGAFVAVMRGNPCLFFARDTWNGAATFFMGSKGNPPYSRLDARLAPSTARLRLHARHLLDRLISSDEAVPSGDADFDAKFTVTSPDRAFALAFFDPARRECIVRLSALGHPEVQVDGGFARIQVGRNLARLGRGARRASNEEVLYGFLSDAALLADAASHLAHPSPAPAAPPDSPPSLQ